MESKILELLKILVIGIFVLITIDCTLGSKIIGAPLPLLPRNKYGKGSNIDEEGDLFESDIAGISVSQGRNAIRNLTKRWLKGVVPYSIDFRKFSVSDVSVIMEAFEEFRKLTCVRFVPNLLEGDFLFITSDVGCWSFIGRRGGRQLLSLETPGCVNKGIAVHELMHALGIWHEQSRHDRDDFIKINWPNIAPKNRHNFQKLSEEDSQTFGLPYDYGSIMHYSSYSFALNKTIPTIVPKQDNATIGQRVHLSDVDASKINKLYECS